MYYYYGLEIVSFILSIKISTIGNNNKIEISASVLIDQSEATHR